jgi:hypothetical protein
MIHLLKTSGNGYIPIKSMMNLNSRMDCFISRDFYIPPWHSRLKIIQMCHDLSVAGYFGFNKTMELISRDFWWPQMWKLVMEFI